MKNTTTYAIPMNGQTSQFEIHAVGCKDLSNPRKNRDLNLYGGKPETVEATDADAAALIALTEDFSGKGEHEATATFPEGSYGAAGFGARVFPCARKVSA